MCVCVCVCACVCVCVYIKKMFLFLYSLPLTGINIRQYCKNCLLSSCYIPVIYVLSSIPIFSVIHLISYVGITSVFIMLTLELEIFSTETDLVSRAQNVLWTLKQSL